MPILYVIGGDPKIMSLFARICLFRHDMCQRDGLDESICKLKNKRKK